MADQKKLLTMTKISSLQSSIGTGNSETFKELYGNEPAILKQQAKRYKNLLQEFADKFNGNEAFLFSSPGRTEIGGNHTDHNFGRVLAGAVNMDNVAAAYPNHTNEVVIEATGYPKFSVNLNDLAPNQEEFFTSSALVRGVASRMKELKYNIGGFNAIIDSGVPKGSGLSSSASFEVLIGAIFSHLFNKGKLDPVQNAIIGQYAENNFFGKPCGLMDQTACSVGGLVTIDFANPAKPIVKKVAFDFAKTGYKLVITNTGGNHANLNEEYASLPKEMKAVAKELGVSVMRQTTLKKLMAAAPKIRIQTGDRAVLRAIHFEQENERVLHQVSALQKKNFKQFLQLIIDSGHSSYMYNQNIFPVNNVKEQGVSLGLAYSDIILKGAGAWRVHGGGFAGTIQAFVPKTLLKKYIAALEGLFGKDSCYDLFIRQKGAIKTEF